MEISAKEFMRMQPNTKKVTEAEKYYMLLATRLAKRWDDCGRFTDLSDSERQAVVLAVVGYFQDIVTDAGIWRSFTICTSIFTASRCHSSLEAKTILTMS